MDTVTSNDYELSIRKNPSGTYQCRFLELPGSNFICEDRGSIFLESEKALSSWLKFASDNKMVVPKSGTHRSVTGAIRVKVGRTLHRRIDSLSEEHNISVNALTAMILQCGAEWLLHELKLIDGPFEMSLKVVPNRGRSDRHTSEKYWTQKVSPELHYTLSWLAKNERLSISALTQFLIGRVVWTMSTK